MWRSSACDLTVLLGRSGSPESRPPSGRDEDVAGEVEADRGLDERITPVDARGTLELHGGLRDHVPAVGGVERDSHVVDDDASFLAQIGAREVDLHAVRAEIEGAALHAG